MIELGGAVARGVVEHDYQVMVGVGFAKVFQERLKTAPVHAGQVKAQALARCRIDRYVEVGPLVGTPYYVRRTKAFGTITSSVPVDQTEARFVEGQNLQRFVGGAALAALFFD